MSSLTHVLKHGKPGNGWRNNVTAESKDDIYLGHCLNLLHQAAFGETPEAVQAWSHNRVWSEVYLQSSWTWMS